MNENMYELTNPQKSIWYTEQYFNDTPINNICGSLLIKQEIDLNVLNTAVNTFIKNNDSFRLRFKIVDGKLMQFFAENEFYNFEIINIENENEIELFAKKEVNKKFNIIDSCLFDCKLFKLSSGFGGLIFNSHHIVSDAATFSIVSKEIVQNYSKLLKNEVIEDKKYSYKDYMDDEKIYLKSSRFEKDKKYWNDQLSPLPEVATFVPQNSTKKDSIEAERKEFVLDINLLDKIKKYCSNNNISIYSFLVSVYSLYFGNINNMNSFLIGTPILNRTNYAEKHTCGMFISTSILKIDLSKNLCFKDFVSDVTKNNLSMLRHQKYNYQCILDDMRSKYSSVPNLFDVLISYQITKAKDNEIDVPYSTKWYGTDYISNALNIHFHDINDTGILHCEYDYQTSKIHPKEIEKMHKRILNMFNQILSNDNINIYDIKVVTPFEEDEILNKFNSNNYYLPTQDMDIIEIFKQQVQINPNKTAVFFEGQKVSYLELDKKSDNLANYLSSLNIQYEDKVGILLDKSVDIIISILAVLKVNAAFLPIDIEYPKDRINYIINNANAKYTITNSSFEDLISSISKPICIDSLCLSGDIKFNYKSKGISSLAYVMYTSGSTGNPKGVMIEQKSIIRLVINPNFIDFGPNERILQTGSIVFDACTFEIWAALLNGFTLYILTKDYLLNSTFLSKYLEKNNISILWLTSPLFNQLCDINPNMFKNVKYLLTGGDVLSPKHINKVLKNNPNLKVINGYGPTENTTFTCTFNIDKKYYTNIPIGYPISGTTCYVVSKFGGLQPIGIPGELWTGGYGVSRGYLNNLELTNEKVIMNPFDNNSMLYKTGDLVQWSQNGYLDFIGRIDDQVKIRGFRIELNEINNTILKFPDVKNSSTIIYNVNESKEICSYIIPMDNIDIDKLKEFLKHFLPNYMIPKYFIIMDSLPITINGKIDKHKLPVPTINTENKTIIEPKTTCEIEIYQAIRDLVTFDNISIDDNFFEDMGLDSLTCMQLCSKLYKYDLSIQDINDFPTIRLLAEKIEKHIKISHFNNILPQIDIVNKKFNFNLNSVLLTGTLGFLGMHILRELLLNNKVKKIYCLVRNKGNQKYTSRFYKSLKYYFNDTLDEQVESKVELVCGDFENTLFGLPENEFNNLCKCVSTVIHCGANVKHYGNFQKFKLANVLGTQNVIDFCKISNARLAHISTVSVGGYDNGENENLVLSENCFNIGQTFNNHVYMITKYLAEYHVLSAINQNQIKGKIFRLGNIMPRISDNVFQFNKSDNAMFCRLQTIINLGKITKSYSNISIDFSPVDLCASAIMTILQDKNKQTIYHIYNNNIISMKDFLKTANINLDYIDEDDFIKEIQDLKNPLSYHLLNDLKNKNKLTLLTNDLTIEVLHNNGFYWNKINKKYIKNLIEFL